MSRSAGTLQRALEPTDELIYEEIRARRDAPDLAERDDVLSLLLQARHDDGSAMSDKELRDELMTLLVAGHETSATALAWALEALTRHPAALERLRDEVDAGDDAYLDAVVKETLRLRPVIALVLRRLVEPMEIGGRLLPAGVNVAPCIYLVHRRPTSTTSRAPSGPSASSRSRRAPTPGSRSAAACAAASARASPSSRSRWCCASWSRGSTSARRAPRAGAPRAPSDRVRAGARRRDRGGAPRGTSAHDACARREPQATQAGKRASGRAARPAR